MNNIEQRIYKTSLQIEERAADSKVRTLKGHASVFNKESRNLGGFREIIAPGAFDNVLDNDVRALFNHDSNLILGRVGAGTLRIGVDQEGLTYQVDLPETQTGKDLAISVSRGDISESSFAFTVAKNGDDWDEDEDGVIIRTIMKIQELFDVSPVTYPAYPDATVAMRSLDTYRKSIDLQAKAQTDIYRKKTQLVEKRSFDRR